MGKNNGSDYNPGGSMFGPQNAAELEKQMLEPVTLTRGKLAEMIHTGVMEITETMAEQFDIQEKTIDRLEITNVQLRRDITALEHKLADANG